MDLFSLFKAGKYFDKHIEPKCDYCQFGRRTKDGNKVLCEKRGMVDCNYSCSKFIYSPLKRIPVKQLNFVGSLADEDIYSESAGDIAEKLNEDNEDPKKRTPKKKKPEPPKAEEKPAEEKPAPSVTVGNDLAEAAKAAEEAAKAAEEAAKAAEEAEKASEESKEEEKKADEPAEENSADSADKA